MGNWILAIVLFLSAAIGITAATMSERANHEARTSYAQSLAGSMQVYRNSVLKYAQAHATSSGEVDDANLALPAWFKRNSDIKTYISGGLGYVYVAVQNDGQARQLLEATNNDVNVGINRGGVLYNPLAGTTVIALPSAIPEGAVVFAPASLSIAGAPPADPAAKANCNLPAGTVRNWVVAGNSCSATITAPTTLVHLGAVTLTDPAPGTTGVAQFYCVDGALQTTPGGAPVCNPPPPCNVAAGTSRSWTVGGNSCSASVGSGMTVAHGTALGFTDPAPGTTGTAQFQCVEGVLATSPDGGASCNPPPPCNVAAGTSRTWTVGAAVCSGSVGATTVASGSSLTFTGVDSDAGVGAAGFRCTEGTLSSTPDGSQTCVIPPAKCVVPAPETETNSRTVTQDVANCPSGSSGTTTQSRTEQQSRTRTAYCPSARGAYVWNAWSAWSGWTAVTGWSTTSNNCQVNCTVPSPSTESHTHWVSENLGCPSGQSGSHTREREEVQIRTAYCPSTTGSYVWTGWGGWSATGNYRNDANTCATNCVVPSPSTEIQTQTRTGSQTLGCPAGQTGSITQTRTEQSTQTRTAYCPSTTGAYAWGAWSGWSAWTPVTGWSTTSNSCVNAPINRPFTFDHFDPGDCNQDTTRNMACSGYGCLGPAIEPCNNAHVGWSYAEGSGYTTDSPQCNVSWYVCQ